MEKDSRGENAGKVAAASTVFHSQKPLFYEIISTRGKLSVSSLVTGRHRELFPSLFKVFSVLCFFFKKKKLFSSLLINTRSTFFAHCGHFHATSAVLTAQLSGPPRPFVCKQYSADKPNMKLTPRGGWGGFNISLLLV